MSHSVRLPQSATFPQCINIKWGQATVKLNYKRFGKKQNKTKLFKSTILPLMSPTHIVMTPQHRLSKMSTRATAGITVISCSCPDSLQKQLGGTSLIR